MSYRDLRNISEFLRRVGYPRIVSLENFRNPNFQLVADIGLWLIKQYDPMTAADFPTAIGTDRDRVKFITSFSEFMLTKVQVKLNMKRLYQADGYAVKELIKVVSILFTAMKEAENIISGESNGNGDSSVDFSTNIEELRRTRMLASEITQKGVNLYDMLQKEIGLREARHIALSKAFELSEVERLLQSALSSAENEFKKSNQLVENLDSNFITVTTKLEKKTQELERNEKRLQTLKKVRPAFMDEYEKLQNELEIAYREYVIRFRVLAHMQNQMEEMSRQDAERKAEERLIKQELGLESSDDLLHFGSSMSGGRRIRSVGGDGGGGGDITGSEDDSDVEEDSTHRNAREFLASRPKVKRPQQGTAKNQINLTSRGNKTDRFDNTDDVNGIRNRSTGKSRQVSMFGGINDSGDSESDLILMDGDNPEDNSELGTDDGDDDEDLAMPMRPLPGPRRTVPNQLEEHIHRQEMQHSASMNTIVNGNGELLINGNSKMSRPITSDKHASFDDGFSRRLEQQTQNQSRTVTTVSIGNGAVKNRTSSPSNLGHHDYDNENEIDEDDDEEDLLIKPLQAPARAMSKSLRTSGRSRSLASTSSRSSGSSVGGGLGNDIKSKTKFVTNNDDFEENYPPRPPTRPRSNAKNLSTVLDDDDDDF